MDYIKDKRTKNLTLRDIHVGDWVQEWSPLTERYDPPTKVMSISDDGDVLLIYDDKHRLTPNEARIENIDALPITPDLLRGFGFEVHGIVDGDFCGEYQEVYLNCRYIGKFLYLERILVNFETDKGVRDYMHELITYLYEKDIDIKLEWKGVEK